MPKILLLKLAQSFVEPSCSYAVKTANAYSSTFLDAHSAFSASGFSDVTRIDLGYPFGVLLKEHHHLSGKDIANSLLNRFTLHDLLNSEYSLFSQSTFYPSIKELIERHDICVVFGGLFASLFHTTATYAIAEAAAQLGKPTLRVGNFSNIESLFASIHSSNISIHNFIDTDPLVPLISWIFEQAYGSLPDRSLLPSAHTISHYLNHHFDFFKQSSVYFESPEHKRLSIYFNPRALKQRVLTIGGGCPQSCTFCPSRKTPSFSRPDFATFELLKSLSDFSPRHRFYVDLLHADPLADKSYSSVSDYARLFIDTSDTKYVTRIQTRLALLKNYNPSHFQALNTRLIYIGLETISSEVSKRSRKYNNSSFDFVDLADIYRSEGIYLRANLIIGLPDEPDDYIDRLVDFANEYPPFNR